jgi:hypothetical protein
MHGEILASLHTFPHTPKSGKVLKTGQICLYRSIDFKEVVGKMPTRQPAGRRRYPFWDSLAVLG